MQKDQISYSQTEGGTSNNNPLLALVTLGKSGQEQPPSLCGLHRLVPTVATDRQFGYSPALSIRRLQQISSVELLNL